MYVHKSIVKHVSTNCNPADIVSRGCCPSQIKYLNLWWNGPYWLSEKSVKWPEENGISAEVKNDALVEERSLSHVASTYEYDLSLFERYLSFMKLIRVMAYCQANHFKRENSDLRKLHPVHSNPMHFSPNKTIFG